MVEKCLLTITWESCLDKGIKKDHFLLTFEITMTEQISNPYSCVIRG